MPLVPTWCPIPLNLQDRQNQSNYTVVVLDRDWARNYFGPVSFLSLWSGQAYELTLIQASAIYCLGLLAP